MTTDTATCDGCSEETFDLIDCEHDRQLCPDCIAEGKCRACYVEGRDEIGATW